MENKMMILDLLTKIKSSYSSDGINILGLFGSFAKGTADKYSDIDIVYEIDYKKFDKKYKGGFAKLLKIDAVKKELEGMFGRKVDLISNKNKRIIEETIYV